MNNEKVLWARINAFPLSIFISGMIIMILSLVFNNPAFIILGSLIMGLSAYPRLWR